MRATTLSIYLKDLREEHGYKQKDLADMLGIARASYSHYETARNIPPNDCLCKIADFYHVPLSNLVRISQSDTIKNCAASDIDAEELANWLTSDDRDLVANYHKLSAHDKSIIKRLARMMAEKK